MRSKLVEELVGTGMAGPHLGVLLLAILLCPFDDSAVPGIVTPDDANLKFPVVHSVPSPANISIAASDRKV